MRTAESADEPVQVVFLHGFLGFSRIGRDPFAIDYFRGLRSSLSRPGISIVFPAVPPSGSTAERAEALALQIARTSGTVVLIGHSMGGLDGRYFVSRLDPDRRVRCLVTLATPHRGSPAARRALSCRVLAPVVRRWWNRALEELTPEGAEDANRLLPDREDVSYLSYAGHRPVVEQPLWLRPCGRLVEAEQGDNDGLVPVHSAQWGRFMGVLRTDHFELVGWSLALPSRSTQRPFAFVRFFKEVIEEALAAVSSAPRQASS